jgi:mannitol 2-dehydrogenase
MKRGVAGCTIQSCDNIQGNGHVARKALINYVEKAEPELLPWIEEHVSFPNAMVDRITPVTVAGDMKKLKEEFLVDDQWPVVCEPFIQWVMEDDFAQGRPEWEKVGVQFVDNVLPFENMKLRLLNAVHSVLGMLGALHGYKTVDEAARDEVFSEFLEAFMDEEVSPILGDLGDIELAAYKKSLLERFRNFHIKDLISRICLESSAKIPIFLLPTIKAQLQGEGNIKRAAFVVAAWCKYNDGVDENGMHYDIEDAMSNLLIRAAALSRQEPIRFLEIEPVFGDLVQNEDFVEAFLHSLALLRSKKVRECVKEMN